LIDAVSTQLIATGLVSSRVYFAEYRIAELRDQLNGREVGFEAGLRRYRQVWRRYRELVS